MTPTVRPKPAPRKTAVAQPKPARVRPLAQQQTDFTNEGSPPPGKVGAHVPSSGPLPAPDAPSVGDKKQ